MVTWSLSVFCLAELGGNMVPWQLRCQVGLTADAAGTGAAGVLAEDFLTIFFDRLLKLSPS